MSEIVLELTGDDAKNFSSIINDINQIGKTLKHNSDYTIINGKCYAYKTEEEDVIHNVLEYDVSSNKNKAKYNDYIQYINGRITDGKEFYKWFTMCKKYIEKVILYDNMFKILTIKETVLFQSAWIDEITKSKDYIPFKNFLSKIKKSVDYKLVYKDDNFEKTINEIDLMNSKRILPYEFNFKTKTSTIKFKMTKRLLKTYKKDSTMSLRIYRMDKKNNIYYIKYSINNKNSILHNYAVIVNYK